MVEKDKKFSTVRQFASALAAFTFFPACLSPPRFPWDVYMKSAFTDVFQQDPNFNLHVRLFEFLVCFWVFDKGKACSLGRFYEALYVETLQFDVLVS